MSTLPSGRLQSDDGRPLDAFAAVDYAVRIAPGHALLVGWTLDAGAAATPVFEPADVKLAFHDRPDVALALRASLAALNLPAGSDARGYIALVALPLDHGTLRLQWQLTQALSAVHELPLSEDEANLGRAWQRLLDAGRSLLAAALALPLSGASLSAVFGAFAPRATDSLLVCEQATTAADFGLLLAGTACCFSSAQKPRLLLLDGSNRPRDVSAQVVWSTRRPRWNAWKFAERPPQPEIGFQLWLKGADWHRPGSDLQLAAIWDAALAINLVSFTAAQASPLRRPEVEQLLALMDVPQSGLARVLDEHFGPAARAVWAGRERPADALGEIVFGEPPAQPDVSVIVPIYRRWDFIEIQRRVFAGDADFARAELIYMIDDPTIYEAVVAHWRKRFDASGPPFRLLYAARNCGFAGANNLAAQVARGQWLVLLNSDVTPLQPGWISGLQRAHAAMPDAGVTGARLLYEDGRIQHDGMAFKPLPVWADLHVNDHPGKGRMPDPDEPLQGPTRVQAVTGACMLILRSLYLELGGFDEAFVRGDFEDSDLCLKLRARGLASYCARGVALQHLERQSIGADTTTRQHITVYNAWLQAQRWGGTLAELAVASESRPGG